MLGAYNPIPRRRFGSVDLLLRSSVNTQPKRRQIDDADRDGLWDGDEAFENPPISKDGVSMRNFRSDPGNFNTDADQLSDGQELRGWLQPSQ